MANKCKQRIGESVATKGHGETWLIDGIIINKEEIVLQTVHVMCWRGARDVWRLCVAERLIDRANPVVASCTTRFVIQKVLATYVLPTDIFVDF